MRPDRAFGLPIPYEASLGELRERVKTPGPQAWAACLALGHKPEKEACDLLVELTGRGWGYRNLALQALGDHPLGAAAAPAIISGLQDTAAQIVRTACATVAKLKLAAAHGPVAGLLKSADPQVRFEALRALAALWAPEDHLKVWSFLQRERTEFVRQEAARVLRVMAGPQDWRHLFDRWKLDPAPKHRVWACELLSAFGAQEDLRELRRLVRDRSVHVRRAAERAAAERGFS